MINTFLIKTFMIDTILIVLELTHEILKKHHYKIYSNLNLRKAEGVIVKVRHVYLMLSNII